MSNEGLGETRVPFSPLRNCRFDSAAATSNPQSQQMISLVCTADSPTPYSWASRAAQREKEAKIRRRNWKCKQTESENAALQKPPRFGDGTEVPCGAPPKLCDGGGGGYTVATYKNLLAASQHI